MSRTTRLVGVLVVVGATAGGALVAHAARPIAEPAAVLQAADRVKVPAAAPSVEQRAGDALLQAVNAERGRRGLAAYEWHGAVTLAATRHSADMAARRRLVHDGSNGSNAGERLTAAGFTWTAWGENIAAGFSDPVAVAAAWLSSPSHRPNMLGNYRYAGIGVASAADGTLYWTLDVANP